MLAQRIHDAGHGGTFLSDGHIDAVYRVSGFIIAALVDDRINGNSRLARLAVTDNQLTLSAADRNHRIHGLQTGLQRLVHGLTIDNARSLAVQRHLAQLATDETLTVQRHSQRIDDTSQHAFTHHNGGNTLGTLHRKSFLDFIRRSQQYGTDIVFLKIHDNAHDAVLKFHQFTGLGISQTIDTCHAIAHLEHGADLIQRDLRIYAFQLFAEDIRNFAYFYIFR